MYYFNIFKALKKLVNHVLFKKEKKQEKRKPTC